MPLTLLVMLLWPAADARADSFTLVTDINTPERAFVVIDWFHDGKGTASLAESSFWSWSLSTSPVVDPILGFSGTMITASAQHTFALHPDLGEGFGDLLFASVFFADLIPLGVYSGVFVAAHPPVHSDYYTGSLDWRGLNETSRFTVSAVHTPEPATGVLTLIGIGTGALMRRIRRARATASYHPGH
jgi:hypothetical protein